MGNTQAMSTRILGHLQIMCCIADHEGSRRIYRKLVHDFFQHLRMRFTPGFIGRAGGIEIAPQAAMTQSPVQAQTTFARRYGDPAVLCL